MVSRVVSIDFTTTGSGRVTRAIKDIEDQSNKATKATDAQAVSAGKLQKSFGALGSTQAQLYNPLKQGLSGIGGALDKSRIANTKFADSLAVGVGVATTAAIGLGAVSAGLVSVVNAARDQERA